MKRLFITTGLFFGILLIYILVMLSKTESFFTYTLDDAYIHLAIAKNFALHKVWGMTQYSFSSSSSSPVFTFLLSVLICIFGDHELIPLFFNVVSAFFMIYFLNKYYSQYFDKKWSVITACLFTVFFSLMHLHIVSGMEHVLQVLVVIINIYFFQKWILSDFKNSNSGYWFFVTILLLGLIRFESMFYFVSLVFVFICLKNFKNAALTLICGFLPILIFGYFNHQQTGYFFPNSVVVKGTQFDFSGNYFSQIKFILLDKMLLNVTFYKVGMLPLFMAVVLIFRDYRNKMSFNKILLNNFLLIVWSLTLILHGLFGNFRGFFRYEAYILVAFSMIVIPRIRSFFVEPLIMFKKDKIMAGLILFNIVLLFYKIGFAHLMIIGSAGIYEQQIQSARFLKKYYNTSKVVANDIGAICYFSDIHLLDIAGLGSKETIPFNENGKTFDNKFEKFLTQYCTENNYELAIVYEEWFTGHVPKSWKKVAVLTINKNANTAIDHIIVYSIDPEKYNTLKENVKSFTWNKNVKVTIAD